jgi:hypothetical protein
MEWRNEASPKRFTRPFYQLTQNSMRNTIRYKLLNFCFLLGMISASVQAQVMPFGLLQNGNAPVAAETVRDITVNGVDYRVHTFTASGDFTVTDGVDVEYLIVAGGGGGGAGWQGGGGGGGGMLEGTTNLSAQTYEIVVGAGGVGTIASATIESRRESSNGEDSSISGVGIAKGGGRGASETPTHAAGNGGSGGGGTHNVLARGRGTAGQGFDGGEGLSASSWWGGGGGGGAGAVGSDANNTRSIHPGGEGLSSAISGSSTVYSKGGDGVRRCAGFNGAAGLANSGGGGGGGCSGNPPTSRGGNGGSGIVIIRYVR